MIINFKETSEVVLEKDILIMVWIDIHEGENSRVRLRSIMMQLGTCDLIVKMGAYASPIPHQGCFVCVTWIFPLYDTIGENDRSKPFPQTRNTPKYYVLLQV